jgi:hypothetical protein
MRFQHHIASSMPSVSSADYGMSVRRQLLAPKMHPLPPTPHRRVGLRRPLRRDPDRHAYGFSITLPQACHRVVWLPLPPPHASPLIRSAPTAALKQILMCAVFIKAIFGHSLGPRAFRWIAPRRGREEIGEPYGRTRPRPHALACLGLPS